MNKQNKENFWLLYIMARKINLQTPKICLLFPEKLMYITYIYFQIITLIQT